MLVLNVCIKFLIQKVSKKLEAYNKKDKNNSRYNKCWWWFPSVYPDLNPEPLINYIDEIKKELDNLKST